MLGFKPVSATFRIRWKKLLVGPGVGACRRARCPGSPGGGVVEPGVGAVLEGVGGGVVLFASPQGLWALTQGSHRRTVFQIGGGGFVAYCRKA